MTSVAVAVKVRRPGTPSSVTSAMDASQATVTVTVPPGVKSVVSTVVVRVRQGTPAAARLAVADACASSVASAGCWRRDAARAASETTTDGRSSWRRVVHLLWSLDATGLIELPPGVPWPSEVQDAAWLGLDPSQRQLARWPRRDRGSRCEERGPSDQAREGPAWRARIGDLLVVSDGPRWRDALQPAIESGAATLLGEGEVAGCAGTIELRTLPSWGTGSMLRIEMLKPLWVAPGAEVEILASLLLGATVPPAPVSVPIAPCWVVARAGRAAVHVGDPASERDAAGGVPADGYERSFGARVESGSHLWMPDPLRAVAWLGRGADPLASSGVWQRFDLVAVGVAGATSAIEGWATAVDRLSWGAEAASADAIVHLVGDGSVSMVIEEAGATVGGRLRPIVAAPTSGQGHSIPERISSPAEREQEGELDRWASRLGRVIRGDESAKIDRRGVAIGRSLLRIDLVSGEPARSRRRLIDAFSEIGLDLASATEAATIAAEVGSFYIGEQRQGEGGLRRKVYIRGLSADDWSTLSSGWPDRLTYPGPTPSWVAWKVAQDHPGQVERAIEVDGLGGVLTIGHALEPITRRVPPEWTLLTQQVLRGFGVSEADRPQRGDSITVEENGRYSVDIFTMGRRRRQGGWTLEAELRSLVVASGHDHRAADGLVAWAGCRDLANFIIGIDKAGEPFVNLYARDRNLRLTTGPVASTVPRGLSRRRRGAR